MENYYNLILIGFIVALSIVLVFWAMNTVRRIAINKNFCADTLTAIAKLWRRAQFIPEDAKERESLFLYRDFLQKFAGVDCKYHLVLKNGGVRVMSRKEYDASFVQKPVHIFSGLLLVASVLVAGIALWVNLTITKMIWVGAGLALVLPVEQLIVAFLLSRVVREKNLYRDAIFVALKENSTNFITITKPFIVVDAYPHKFGKNAQPLYTAKGDLSPEMVEEIRGFVMEQKRNEVTAAFDAVTPTAANTSETPVNPVDDNANQTEMPVSNENANTVETEEKIENEITKEENHVTAVAVADEIQHDNHEVSEEERASVLSKFIQDMAIGEIQRVEREAAEKGEPFQFSDEEIMEILSAGQDVNPGELGTITGEPVQNVPMQAETVAPGEESFDVDMDFSTPIQELAKAPIPDENTPIVEPDEDDFSLEAIGLALDAEIAKRNASGKK